MYLLNLNFEPMERPLIRDTAEFLRVATPLFIIAFEADPNAKPMTHRANAMKLWHNRMEDDPEFYELPDISYFKEASHNTRKMYVQNHQRTRAALKSAQVDSQLIEDQLDRVVDENTTLRDALNEVNGQDPNKPLKELIEGFKTTVKDLHGLDIKLYLN